MHILLLLIGVTLGIAVLLDSFQTIILPRRPVSRFRLTRLFLLSTWTPYTWLVNMNRDRRKREQLYSFYGPLSLLLLFVVWAVCLVSAFAFIYFGLRVAFVDPWHPATALDQLLSCFYVSGSTLFTLGLGDVIPARHLTRFMIDLEAGTGLGFIALVIGYVPVLYTAFSAREMTVALLDARAGSPPTTGELLLRHHFDGGDEALTELLAEWERWCASMLETHISYPILCYYRSQHDNQSWLSALTAVLDTCSLLITSVEGPAQRQAQLTFAIGRHVLVDIGHVFHRETMEQKLSQEAFTRLDDDEFSQLCDLLRGAGIALCADLNVRARLDALRKLYEPHACAMARYLQLDLPHWTPPPTDPAKPGIWTSIGRLRSPSGSARPLTSHISAQATASHLGDDEGFL
jgi:Ion channel